MTPDVREESTHVSGEYNATLVAIREVRPWLRIIRIRPDDGPLRFIPGQYTALGLGSWESYVEGAPSLAASGKPKLIRRAYSFSSPMLDEDGRLVAAGEEALLEFYIVLATGTDAHPAELTPRLFRLRVGDRLFVSPHPKGTYTLAVVQADQDVVFAATGTGEAPHNVMLAKLLASGHRGRILSVVGAREAADFAYQDVHRELERRYANYQYVTLTTREPCNLDATRADFIGKQYVQQFLAGPHWEKFWGPVNPANTHVFVCGNPQMIGIPRLDEAGRHVYPQPQGAIETLEARGFRAELHGVGGNIHFEKYW